MTFLLDIGDVLPLGEVWGSTLGFVAIMVGTVVVIGFGSRSLAVGALSGYTMFAHYAIETDIQLLNQTFYATFVLIIIAFAFKLFRSEGISDI